jgi:serine phosphatase RsbU (regulator of sigma subunit)/anti-sigma regulatory factor (Ser/Thr protein kinase)
MSYQETLTPPIGVVRYTIPADTSLVGTLRKRFIDSISNGELNDPDLAQWTLVFSELVFNAIFHGAKNDPNHTINVEWSITQNSIILGALDPGQGPADEALESPSLPSDPTAESGRGLFILNEFADELRHSRGPHGFFLEVVKYYPNQGLPLPGNPEIDSVIDELSSCYESLSVFHRLTENLIESGNLRDFIGTSLDEFLSLHPLDTIFFLGSSTLPERVREALNKANWFLDQENADLTLRTLGTLTRETVWENFEDLTRQNSHFKSLSPVGAGCVFPIVAGGIHFGALIALRKQSISSVQRRSLGILRTLADLCGIACANTHLSNIRDESQKDLRELEIAVNIQKALLPIIPPPKSDRWLVSIYQESSLTIAGDYAIARMDSEGNLVVAMIDVMGKGVSAALLASIFRTAFEMSLNIPTSCQILDTINKTLCSQLGDLSMFITCAIARISADGKSIDHSSAGHCPTFFYQTDGTRLFLHPSGPPLGILPQASYSGNQAMLSGGERLVFITDGCYEWDRSDEDFGWHRFVELMDENRTSTPQQLWAQVRERIRSEYGNTLEDDCTLVTLDILL